MPRHALLVTAIIVACGLHAANAADCKDWPSYNRTLTSERFAALDTINTKNVRDIKVLCSYDTG